MRHVLGLNTSTARLVRTSNERRAWSLRRTTLRLGERSSATTATVGPSTRMLKVLIQSSENVCASNDNASPSPRNCTMSAGRAR